MGNKSKSIALVIVALFLTSLVTISFAPSTQGAPTWNTQRIIDKASAVFGIAVDSNGYPHIAYTAFLQFGVGEATDSVYRIFYTSWNGASWVNQTLPLQIGFSDLALDAQNNVHIVGIDNNNGMLWYIHWTGQDWSIQKVANDATEASIALDSESNPHIAYLTFDSLKYASWNGSKWVTTVADTANMLYRVSLKIDSSNYPHILYQTEDDNKTTRTNLVNLIKYATFDNASGWKVRPVSSTIDFGNLVLDKKGHPHFANETAYFSWTGSKWTTQSFRSKFNSTTYPNDVGYVALDKNDYPSIDIVAMTQYSSALTYLRWSGNDWIVQTVAPTGTIGPIAVDSKGNPHLCYISSGNMGIFGISYATANESTITGNNFSLIAVIVSGAVLLAILSLLFYQRHRKSISQNKPNV